ncbi:MAG: amino acid ABC transporter permease [Kineosporiaceae bacterium]|nr:amino acid ABC transporter permease [Kineosporiaceae bacterium]
MSAQAVLFDAPGPRARARHRILTVLGALLVLAVAFVVVRKMNDAGQLDSALWTPFLTDPAVWSEYLLLGLWATVKAAVFSIALAGAFGLLFGTGRLSHNAAVRWACGVIVEFFRAVPVLIMMLFLGFGVYPTIDAIPDSQVPLVAVVTALTLYNGSVVAELVRAGVRNLPKGQGEAGLSIGLTRGQTLRLVQLPQALRHMLPALIGQFVVALKDSALGYAILYQELLTWGKTLGSAYSNTVPAYLVVALMFILLNVGLTHLAMAVDRRMSRRLGDQGAAGPLATGPEPELEVLHAAPPPGRTQP